MSKDVLVVCDFCRDKYHEREQLCVLIDAERLSKGSRICVKCLPELGITGCTFVSGRGYEYDRLGTDDPPELWEFDRPSWREQLGALAGDWPRDPYEHPSELTTSASQPQIVADGDTYSDQSPRLTVTRSA